MSVILEALRKSEAERQRGRAPGLFVEQVPARARARGLAGAWPWVLAVLLLLVLAAWAWREWGRAAETNMAATPTAAETAAAPAPVLAPVPLSEAPAPYRSEAIGAVPAPPVVRPAAPSQAAPASPAAAIAPPPEPSLATNRAAPITTVAEPPPAPREDTIESLPTVASLAASERSQLPPLKLSMHVYADETAQRFVILDGKRLGEGASPAPGLVLEQIRRDGLVLSVNGQRLLLARP